MLAYIMYCIVNLSLTEIVLNKFLLSKRMIKKSSFSRLHKSANLRKISTTYQKQFREIYYPYINGAEFTDTKSKDYFQVESPASREILCKVLASDKDIATIAIKNAQETFQSGVWSKIDVRVRAKILNNIAERLRENIPRLAEMEVAQTGRAVREMKAQVFL